MTPSARVQAAIDILDDVFGKQVRFEDYFRTWSRQNRYAGSKDRAAIKEIVFQVFRHYAELRWRVRDITPRMAVAALLRWVREDTLTDIEALFSGQRYAPARLSERERQSLQGECPADRPRHVALNVPDWLVAPLVRQFGDEVDDELDAMSGRAPLHIRANALKTARGRLKADLGQLGIESRELQESDHALGVAPETQLQTLDLFDGGAFEIQDLGSQIAGDLCLAKPGMLVMDLAAGAGGKTLQLAAALQNIGRVIACDVDGRRLERLQKRASRAGVDIVETCVLKSKERARILTEFEGQCDVVLVDAPCSGSGTWRRRPEARWWLTREMIDQFREIQLDLLRFGSHLVSERGRLVYVTCSVLPDENQDVVEEFERMASSFQSSPLHETAKKLGVPDGVFSRSAPGLQLTPRRLNTDGFFINVFRKNSRRTS